MKINGNGTIWSVLGPVLLTGLIVWAVAWFTVARNTVSQEDFKQELSIINANFEKLANRNYEETKDLQKSVNELKTEIVALKTKINR